MQRKFIIFCILLIALYLFSCTALPKRTERIVDTISEDYYNKALIALQEKNISRALTFLLLAQKRSPESRGDSTHREFHGGRNGSGDGIRADQEACSHER